MLYVRIELWPRGNREAARLLHEGIIANVGGTKSSGVYLAKLSRCGGFGLKDRLPAMEASNVWQELVLEGFPRLRLNAWHLLSRVFERFENLSRKSS